MHILVKVDKNGLEKIDAQINHGWSLIFSIWDHLSATAIFPTHSVEVLLTENVMRTWKGCRSLNSAL